MRVRLTNRSFLIYIALAGLATLFIALDQFLAVGTVGIVLLVFLLLVDLRQLPNRQDFRVELAIEELWELEHQANLEFFIEFKKSFSWQLKIDLAEFPTRYLDCKYDSYRQIIYSDSVRLQLPAEARVLGRESLNLVYLSVLSRLGLWKRVMPISLTEKTIQVVPPLVEMPKENFEKLIRSQRTFLYGNRVRLRQRQRDQFHSIREFAYPDSMKNIDAKKSLKYQRLMVREFETVQKHHLVVAFDIGRAMFGVIRSNKKHDFYLSAAFWLIRYAIEKQDSVSFVSFCQREHLIIPRTNTLAPFQPVLNHDQGLSPREEDSDFQRIVSISSSQAQQRSIFVIFTDASRLSTQHTLLQSIGSLSRKHLVVVVSLLDRIYSPGDQIEEFTDQACTEEYYLRLQYSHALEESFSRFQREMNLLGAFALQIPEPHWMHTSRKVYDLLRSSIRA